MSRKNKYATISDENYKKFDGVFLPCSIVMPLMRVGICTINDIYECHNNGWNSENKEYSNLLELYMFGNEKLMLLSNILEENGYRPLIDERAIRNKIPKETPRDVIVVDRDCNMFVCPRCNDNRMADDVVPLMIARYDYCYMCGQHLEWGDIKGFYRGKRDEQ